MLRSERIVAGGERASMAQKKDPHNRDQTRKEAQSVSEYYSTQQAAEALGVCRARVLQMRREGKLTAYSRGEKGSKSKFFFRVEDVENYKLHKNDEKPLPPLRPVGVDKGSA